jgi:hypothetical protein
MSTRQIVYLVRKREKELHEKIFLGGGKGSPLYLTIPLLSKYFPEFVDDRFAVTEILKNYLKQIDATQVEMKKAIVSNRKTISNLLGSEPHGLNSRSNTIRREVHRGGHASHARSESSGYKCG